MINATIIYSDGMVIGFAIENHGKTLVCAAVSMLAINTVNSIEKLTCLTKNDFTCTWNDNGGFMACKLNFHHHRNSGAGILLDALELGLTSLSKEYPSEIKLEKLDTES